MAAMLNDLTTWLAVGAVLGAIATVATSGSLNTDLPVNILVGMAGAMLADNFALPSLAVTSASVIDAERLVASIVGAGLLIAAVNFYFREEY